MNKPKFQFLAAILAVIVCAGLISCGSKQTSDNPDSLESEDKEQTMPSGPINYPPVTYESLGRTVRITCIGDSLTWGDKASDPTAKSYPAQLQDMLGSHYSVSNCSKRGAVATKMAGSAMCFCYESEWNDAMKSEPDVAVIMFGTNDANPYQQFDIDTERGKQNYLAGMKYMISELQNLESPPKIYLCTSPWIYDRADNFKSSLENYMIPMQHELASELGLELIDIFSATKDHPEYYAEGLHLNDDGYRHLAEVVKEALMT